MTVRQAERTARRRANRIRHQASNLRCVAGQLRRMDSMGLQLKVIASQCERAAQALEGEINEDDRVQPTTRTAE